MSTVQLQLSDVIYNAATQSFEALVTLHDQHGARSYACAIAAPIDMDFKDAAAGLAAQAKRRDAVGKADSVFSFATPAPSRTDLVIAKLKRLTTEPFDLHRPRAA